MNKTLSKAIFERTKLRKTFLKIRRQKKRKVGPCKCIMAFYFFQIVSDITAITSMRKTFVIIKKSNKILCVGIWESGQTNCGNR